MAEDQAGVRELATGWRLLAGATALVLILIGVVIQVTQDAVIPPLVVLALAFVVGLVLLVTRPRAGSITIGAAAVVMVVANLPFVAEDLTHPESIWSFLPAAVGVVGALVGLVVLVGALRRSDDGAVPYVGVIAGVAVLGLVAFAAIQTSGQPDDARQEGDFGLFAQDFAFVPDTIDSASGEIGVFLGNDDLVRHTFTIDELGVHEELPSKAFVRFSFEAEAGTYEFTCDVPGHEDMTGTLTVVDL